MRENKIEVGFIENYEIKEDNKTILFKIMLFKFKRNQY